MLETMQWVLIFYVSHNDEFVEDYNGMGESSFSLLLFGTMNRKSPSSVAVDAATMLMETAAATVRCYRPLQDDLLSMKFTRLLQLQQLLMNKHPLITNKQTNKQTPWPLVRERTIPTERPPLVDEI
jgi:hypothetical protein